MLQLARGCTLPTPTERFCAQIPDDEVVFRDAPSLAYHYRLEKQFAQVTLGIGLGFVLPLSNCRRAVSS